MTTYPIADNFAQALACAVLDDEQRQFNELTQDAAMALGMRGAAVVISRLVPVLLPKESIPTLLRWQTGEDSYEDIVRAFLAELLQVLLSKGLSGSYDGQQLRLTPATWAWVEENYEPSAVACCRPYVLVASS
jgi:hypothetical protein